MRSTQHTRRGQNSKTGQPLWETNWNIVIKYHRNESTCSDKDFCPNILSNQRYKRPCWPISCWVDGQTFHTHRMENYLAMRRKKLLTQDTTQMYPETMKLGVIYILSPSFYLSFQRRQNCGDRKQIGGRQGPRGRAGCRERGLSQVIDTQPPDCHTAGHIG